MTRIAPAKGASPEFDRTAAAAIAELAKDAASAVYGETVMRDAVALAFQKHGGGKTFGPAADEHEVFAMPAQPKRRDPDAVPADLIVPAVAVEEYWWDRPEDARFLEWFIGARREMGPALPGGLLVTGPAGSGKTRSVIRTVASLGLPFLKMDCPTVTDEQRWFGRRTIDHEGDGYETSDFIKAVESGWVILLDEFMRLHPRIHNGVMSLVDSTETVHLTDLNLTITRHPQTVFIGTTNQGSQFGGTHKMDWAMRERWSYTIERGFPPADEEIRVLVTNHPGCDPDAARVLVEFAEATRRMYEGGDIAAPVSTRTLCNAAYLIAAGMTEAEALGYTAFPEYDAGAEGQMVEGSQREKVMGILAGKGL